MAGTPAAPLRLLFVGSLPRWGGGGRWLVQSAHGLAARGHDVHVVTPPGSKLLARATDAGLRTHVLASASWRRPGALLHLRRLLGSLQPAAVFVQRTRDAELLSWCSWPATPPPLFLRLGAETPEVAALARLVRRRRVACAFTSSQSGRLRLQQAGLQPEALRVLRDGVPVAAGPAPDRDALRRHLKLPRKAPLVLQVGHLEAHKGQETSLRALATLRIWRPGAVPNLAFLGTGPDEARLHDLGHQLGIKEHVVWLGFRTDVASYMQAADILIQPSRRAGVAWTLLEAMAQGVPVLAGSGTGNAELIAAGTNGILVPPDDPTALADAMTQVLDDAALALRLGRQGAESVRHGWSEAAMLDDLECMLRAQQLRQNPVAGALYVDRDDKLVRYVPYNSDPDQVELLPGAARALRWVRDAGIPIVVVSNQSGIAQGLHGEAEVLAVNERLRELLRAEGADVDAVYFCPHHPDHGPPCACRKPEPGLLLQAAQELHLDLRRSLMVGNAARDLEAGRRAGCAAAVALLPAGASTDLDAGTPVYTSWTALVRDFLAAVAAPDSTLRLTPPARVEPRPGVAEAGDAAARRDPAGDASAAAGAPSRPQAKPTRSE